MEFTPHGVCSKNIHLEVDEAGRIHNVEFTGGCNGNLQGIGRLVEGMGYSRSNFTYRRYQCGYKATSCPDQLSLALKEYLNITSNQIIFFAILRQNKQVRNYPDLLVLV